MSRISCIIPVRNDVVALENLLVQLLPYAEFEDIVVVSSTEDQDITLLHARFPKVRFLQTSPGRAKQLNFGAAAARGDLLWFLHADSKIPAQAAKLLREAIEANPDCVGAFRFALSSRAIWARLIEWGARIRSERFLLPYGDQGLFCRAEVYQALGTFPEKLPMEDLQFIWRARTEKRVRVLPEVLQTSARKWEQKGVCRTSLRHARLLFDFLRKPKETWSSALPSR